MVKITAAMRRMVYDPEFRAVITKVIEAQDALRSYEAKRRDLSRPPILPGAKTKLVKATNLYAD